MPEPPLQPQPATQPSPSSWPAEEPTVASSIAEGAQQPGNGMSAEAGPEGGADEPCGIFGAATPAVSAMVGGGVFATMGAAMSQAGGAAPLAFAVGVIPACLTAYSYARMTLEHPHQGGTAGFLNKAFGTGYLAASLNLMLIVCYACIASLYVGIFGTYLASLVGIRGHDIAFWSRAFSWLAVGLVAFMNLSPAHLPAKLQPRLNAIKLLVMAVFVAAAFFAPTWQPSNFDLVHWKFSGIWIGGMMIFVSYQGFELIAADKRPFKNPARTVPWAYVLCLAVVLAYNVLIAIATVGNAELALLPRESSYIISAVAERFMGTGGAILLSTGAVVSAVSALNADVFSVSKMPVLMAEEREMPAYFSPNSPGSPVLGVLFICALLIVFSNLLTMEELIAVSSMGFLGIYAIVNAVSLMITRRTKKACWLSGMAVALCVVALAVLCLELGAGPHARLVLGVAGAMLGLPFAWQALYFSVRRLWQNRAR